MVSMFQWTGKYLNNSHGWVPSILDFDVAAEAGSRRHCDCSIFVLVGLTFEIESFGILVLV